MKVFDSLKNTPPFVLWSFAGIAVMGIVIGTVYAVSLKGHTTQQLTVTPTPTQTQSPTISVTDIQTPPTGSITPTVTPSAPITETIKYNITLADVMSAATFKYSFTLPKTAKVVSGGEDYSGADPTRFDVTYSGVTFSVAQRYEAYPQEFKTVVPITTAMGQAYRVTEPDGDLNTYSYVTAVKMTGTCESEEPLKAPCGISTMGYESMEFLSAYTCVASVDKIDICDAIVKSIVITPVIANKTMTLTDQLTKKKFTYHFAVHASATISAIGSNGESFSIVYPSGTKMIFSQRYEGYAVQFTSATPIDAEVDNLSRVVVKGSSANTYNYASNVFTSTKCLSPDGNIPAPCGAPLVADAEIGSLTSVMCTAQSDKIAECDRVMAHLWILEAEK